MLAGLGALLVAVLAAGPIEAPSDEATGQRRPPPAPLSWPLNWGALNIRSRAPLIDARLSFAPGRVLPVQRGQSELQLALSYVNVWAQMPGYFYDGEFARLDARIAYGIAEGTEVLLEGALAQRSGGIIDGFIEGFHALFGITQARRDRYPRNQLRVVTHDAKGTTVQLRSRDAGLGITNPTLGVRRRLTRRGAWPALAGEFKLKLPVGSIARSFATPGISLLGALSLQQPLGARFGILGSFGVIVSPIIYELLGVPLTEVQKFFMFAVTYRAAARWLIVAQYLNHDGIAERAVYAPLNMTTHEFALGVKWAPRGNDSLVLEAGLIENTVHDANTPDFGAAVGLRLRTG